MKFSYGETYKEAVSYIPMTGFHIPRDEEVITTLLNKYPVVLDYKKVQKGQEKYSWRYHGPFCYIIYDCKKKQYIMNEAAPEKIQYFKSIRRAMEWIYDHNREFYDSIPNLSTKEKKGE